MSQESLSEEIRFRVPLPFVIPIVSLLVIGAVTFGMSRILLSVPKEVAVVIAVAVAANLLIAAAFIANRPESARSSWIELFIVFAYPLVIGAVLMTMNLGEAGHAAAGEEAGGHAPAGEEGGGSGLSISAVNIQFSTDTLEFPAGEETSLEFVNEEPGSILHNVAIYEEEGGADLFIGETIPGGETITYDVPGMEAGEFYFQCDVHPGMNGTVLVE